MISEGTVLPLSSPLLSSEAGIYEVTNQIMELGKLCFLPLISLAAAHNLPLLMDTPEYIAEGMEGWRDGGG